MRVGRPAEPGRGSGWQARCARPPQPAGARAHLQPYTFQLPRKVTVPGPSAASTMTGASALPQRLSIHESTAGGWGWGRVALRCACC